MMTFMEKIILIKNIILKMNFLLRRRFFKRIKIIKPNETSRNAINIPKNINKSTFVNKHPNLKLLLNYINQEDNKYRENFNIWITGLNILKLN